jgi:hypothetical protein
MDTSQVIVMCVLLNFLFFFFMGQFNFLGLVSLLLVSNTVLSLKEFKDCCEFGISLHFDILIVYIPFLVRGVGLMHVCAFLFFSSSFMIHKTSKSWMFISKHSTSNINLMLTVIDTFRIFVRIVDIAYSEFNL